MALLVVAAAAVGILLIAAGKVTAPVSVSLVTDVRTALLWQGLSRTVLDVVDSSSVKEVAGKSSTSGLLAERRGAGGVVLSVLAGARGVHAACKVAARLWAVFSASARPSAWSAAWPTAGRISETRAVVGGSGHRRSAQCHPGLAAIPRARSGAAVAGRWRR